MVRSSKRLALALISVGVLLQLISIVVMVLQTSLQLLAVCIVGTGLVVAGLIRLRDARNRTISK